MSAQADDETADDAWLQSVIPVLPTPAATTCMVLNIVVPGSGTLAGGLCLCCCGTPRLNSEEVKSECCGRKRFLMSTVSVLIGISQFLTVILCLVGWLWSIVWGVIMATLSGVGQDSAVRKRKARKKQMAKGKRNIKVLESDTVGQKNFKRLMMKVQETGGEIKPDPPPVADTKGKWKWRPACWTSKVHEANVNGNTVPTPKTTSAIAAPTNGPPKPAKVHPVVVPSPTILDAKSLMQRNGPSTTAYYFKT